MPAIFRVSSPLSSVDPSPKGALRFPRLHHSLLQACSRGDPKTLFAILSRGCPKRNDLLGAGQKQLRIAFFRSIEQEFEPDVNNIRSHGTEVKDEIALAKAQRSGISEAGKGAHVQAELEIDKLHA